MLQYVAMKRIGRRDARPFLAHHLRERADDRMSTNGADLHALARWVENLPSDDPRIIQVGATAVLDYSDGHFEGGGPAESLVDNFRDGDAAARDRWLDFFAAAVAEAQS